MSGIFENGVDDYMFPTTRAGIIEAGMVMESASLAKKDDAPDPRVGNLDAYMLQDARRVAINAALSWVEDGEYTYDSLDEALSAAADLDGDYELDDDEQEYYRGLWDHLLAALEYLGADEADLRELADGPGAKADKAAARLGQFLFEKMDNEELDDEALIMDFAFQDDGVMENAMKKLGFKIRDGVKTMVRKAVGHVKLSGAQKRALKKARRKAHTGMANKRRAKSFAKGERMGLHK